MEIKRSKRQEIIVHIRPMCEKDLDEVLTLENECALDPYPKKLIRQFIKDSSCENFVALSDGNIIGFIICMTIDNYIDMIELVVAMGFREGLVGTKLLQRAINMIKGPIRRIITHVADSNDSVPAQLLLKKNRFRASPKIVPRYFQITEGNSTYYLGAIKMVYYVPPPPINRISKYMSRRRRG